MKSYEVEMGWETRHTEHCQYDGLGEQKNPRKELCRLRDPMGTAQAVSDGR